MQFVLRVIAILSFVVASLWWFYSPGFEPLSAVLVGLLTLLTSFVVEKSKGDAETLDQRNRRVMLDHVENFWVRGILEKSLHGAALLELGIKEDPQAVSYPWTIKKESTGEFLPAGKSMLEIFREIGMGRSLLILGAPGSGKTTMLLELARELIECARVSDTEPIPVVFNLASWREKQSLADWLAEQLNILYYVPRKIAPFWVGGNKMLLLLDGLDEVKADSRDKCVEAINLFRNEHGLTSLVVCSRTAEYAAIGTKLSFEGAITLQPLTVKQVNAYFDRLGKSLAGVKQLLKRDSNLRELAETPLMLSIMTLAYKDVKPDELLSSSSLEDRRKHLFTTYVDRMFERSTRSANATYTKGQTLHYLGWLARTMIRHNVIAYQIESMQPAWLADKAKRRQYSLYLGLFGWLFGGLIGGVFFGISSGPSSGLYGGLLFGLFVGLRAGLSDSITMEDRLRWGLSKGQGEWRFVMMSMLKALLYGGIFIGVFVGALGGLFVGLLGGLLGGLLVGLLFGLVNRITLERVEETSYPGQRLKQTLSTALVSASIWGLFLGLLFGLIGGLLGGLMSGLLIGVLFGLIGGLLVAPFFGLFGGLIGFSSIMQHYCLRWLLTRHGLLPRQLISFLEYSVSLIFLRRVGGSYIFVHRLLMEHFAEMEV